MDFHLDDDQRALQEAVAGFCKSRWPIEGLAARSIHAFDASAWADCVDLGLPGLLAPESNGGLGLGCVEGAIAFEQLGRHLVPGPLLWSALAALLIPEVATGAVVATGIDARADAPYLVESLRSADLLLVLRSDEVAVVECAAIDSTPIDQPFDPVVFTRDGILRMSSASRTTSAVSSTRSNVAPTPGSRSKWR